MRTRKFIKAADIEPSKPLRKPISFAITAYCHFCINVKADLFHYYRAIPLTPTGKTHAKCYVCLSCLLRKVTYMPTDGFHDRQD